MAALIAPEQQVSTALAAVLASGRAHFNASVTEARHRYPAFETAAFAAFLRTGLDSVARSVAAVAPERTTAVVVAAYDVALELVAQGLAGPGARTELVERVWVTLAPRYASLVAADPVEVLGALSNAVLNIAKVPTARVDEWLDGMAALARHADSSARLLSLGQIMAWRAGLAHFRDGALHCADALPESLALLVTGAEGAESWSAIRDAFRADPWWSPDAEQREAVRNGVETGQFTGFGGTFAQPPEVRAGAEGFFVRSADRFSLLIADAYGAVLLPASAEEFAHAASVTQYLPATLDGLCVAIGDRRIDLDLPEDGLALVANEHTIALSSPYTHAIRLLPRS